MPPVEPREPNRAVVYERTIGASLARIWENVLDWQHLPWLHKTSFADVKLVDASADGWRGWVTARSRRARESLVDVHLDRPALRYRTCTIDGEGSGTEIWTRLEPTAERSTRIRVEFAFPGLAPEVAAETGTGYVRLYARLWDEDEAMMLRRQTLLDAGGGRLPLQTADERSIALGSLGELRKRLPLVLRVGGRELRLVELDGEIRAHPTVCPHFGGPLGDAAIEDGCLTCPWHGYRYDLRSGRCVNGQPFHLDSVPIVRLDAQSGEAELVW